MSEWQEPSAIAFHRDKAPLAIALLSDTASEFDKVDIGRASQNMTLVACGGIGSCLMSGPGPPEGESFRRKAHDFLKIPSNFYQVNFRGH